MFLFLLHKLNKAVFRSTFRSLWCISQLCFWSINLLLIVRTLFQLIILISLCICSKRHNFLYRVKLMLLQLHPWISEKLVESRFIEFLLLVRMNVSYLLQLLVCTKPKVGFVIPLIFFEVEVTLQILSLL